MYKCTDYRSQRWISRRETITENAYIWAGTHRVCHTAARVWFQREILEHEGEIFDRHDGYSITCCWILIIISHTCVFHLLQLEKIIDKLSVFSSFHLLCFSPLWPVHSYMNERLFRHSGWETYNETTKRQERKKQKSDTRRSKMFVNHRLNTMKWIHCEVRTVQVHITTNASKVTG